MAEITAQQVKQLRELTGAGMMDCKRALQDAGGDMKKAQELLREWGLASALKKQGRTAAEGLIHSYIHHGGKVGVLVEVNCETDFVARTTEFQQLAHDIALQIAAAKPLYVNRSEVPQDVIERERAIFRKEAQAEGKPEKVIERIVDGKMEKFFSEICLEDQPFIRDDKKTVGELVTEAIAQLGENIRIRRFARFELGELQNESDTVGN